MERIGIPFRTGQLAGACFSSNGHSAGPCVILCHGAFEYKENFFPFARHLAGAGIHAIVIDMPGHGQSTGDRFHIDIPAWVAAISATIEYASQQVADPDRIGLFGFSSGGTAVLEAAICDPRIKAIATLDATVRNYMNAWDTVLFKLLIGLGKTKKRLTGTDWRVNLTNVLEKAEVACDPDVNQQIVSDPRMIEAYRCLPLPGAAPCAFVDTIERVDAIRIPSLILHGKEDRIDPLDSAHLLYNRLTCEKSLEIIPNSGHCGHLDTNGDMIMRLVGQWMTSHL